jgi:hypothetical protein
MATKITHIDNHALEDSHKELMKALSSMLRGNKRFGDRWVVTHPSQHALEESQLALENAKKVYKTAG